MSQERYDQLRAELAKKDEEIKKLREAVRRFERDWLEACDVNRKLQADLDRVMREAVDAMTKIQKIGFLLGNDPRLNPAYEMRAIAQQFLESWRERQGKEA